MLLELYAAITRLMMSAPCHLSLLPNCIGDMERVHNEDDLLMLSLPGQIFMQRSTRYRMELVWRDFTWCKSLAKGGMKIHLDLLEQVFWMPGPQQYAQGGLLLLVLENHLGNLA